MSIHRTFLNWSTGKDAALALHYLRESEHYSVEHLLTSVNAHFNRVSMHGLRRELMEAQIRALGLPHSTMELAESPTMEAYNAAMAAAVEDLKAQDFTHAAYGDIFLEDLRNYREQALHALGVEAVFPIWKRDTRTLLKEFINLGFRAVIVAADAQKLGEDFVGRELDHDFLFDLPKGVDPCGENGEFHTFCFDGPIFSAPVEFVVGEKVYKEYAAPKKDEAHDSDATMGFWFCDLLPPSTTS